MSSTPPPWKKPRCPPPGGPGPRAARSLPPRRLPVVVRLAERLPVGLVPEPLRVAAVRDDVVDHGRDLDPPFLPALDAERIRPEEARPGPLPRGPVAPSCRAAAPAVGLSPYLSQVSRTAIPTPHERGTSRVHAWARRVVRHRHLQTQKAPAPDALPGWGPAGQLPEIYVAFVRAAMPLLTHPGALRTTTAPAPITL